MYSYFRMQRTMLDKRFILLFLLILPLASAVSMNDTLFVNTITNYSIYINETVTFDEARVTDAGRIEFYNPITDETIGRFYNINDTYNSVVDFYNLTNALIFYGNGTIIQQEFTGQINISVPILTNITVMNNYIIDDGETPASGDTINRGGGSGDTKVNNTLVEPVSIQIINLNKSFIFMSNLTVLRFVTGSLNITISEDEYFYIVDYEEYLRLNENEGTIAHDSSTNSNDATINGASWDNDGVLVTLIDTADYTVDDFIGILEILNQEYVFGFIMASWVYLVDDQICSDEVISLLELAVLFLSLAVMLFSIGYGIYNQSIRGIITAFIGLIMGGVLVPITMEIINNGCLIT